MSNDMWSVILIIGIAGWIVSSIMLMLKAFPQKDAFITQSAVRWGGAAAVSFLIWVVGMLNA